MNNPTKKWWWFVLLPALAMWLGWGVRGLFGHANGAMLPGALVALAVSFLLKGKRFSLPLAIAMTAVGFGFGAEETTLQTAGLLMGKSGANPFNQIHLGLAYSGLALKGGLWAMFGGAGLGLALTGYLHRKLDLVIGVILMGATFYLGWWTINRPKLIYFSIDRSEIWCGLLFGGITLLAWMTLRGGTRIPLKLAGWAALGGGIGYPIAVTIATLGRHSAYPHGDWWKVAETTFGAFMGAAIGTGTYLLKDQLPDLDATQEAKVAPALPTWAMILLGALGAMVGNTLYAGAMVGGTARGFHDVMPWIYLGPILWCVAFYWQKAAWHIGFTMAFFASAADLLLWWNHDQELGNTFVLWVLLALATLMVSWKVTGWAAESEAAAAPKAFVFLIWAAAILSNLLIFGSRELLHPVVGAVVAAGGRGPYLLQAVGRGMPVALGLTLGAVVLTWMVARLKASTEPPAKSEPTAAVAA